MWAANSTDKLGAAFSQGQLQVSSYQVGTPHIRVPA